MAAAHRLASSKEFAGRVFGEAISPSIESWC